jgi:glycosyltransferase involved in cell wall biosynthesis
MKKIVYILTTYPCPSETFTQRELTQLHKLGFVITVFAANGRTMNSAPKQNVPVYYRPSFLSLSAAWSIIRTALRHPARLVKLTVLMAKLLFICPKEAIMLFANFHTVCFFAKAAKNQHAEHIHACFLSWPACIALGVSTLTKLPFSIATHARDIFVEGGAVRLKVQKARFITCCTKQGLEYLKNHIDSTYHNKLFLNYHGIELHGLHNSFNYQQKGSSEFIIAIGRLVEKKGFVHLIEAFSQIVQKRPNSILVIAGDGPQRKCLRDTIERLEIGNKVHLAGWLDHNQTLRLLEQAKILVVPSIIDTDGDRDGIPNVILEAFSVGTPVIASSLAGISEAVINEKTALLVKPGDNAQLTAAIEKLLSDEGLAVFLAANAKETLINNFNIKKSCLKLAELFENDRQTNEKMKIAHIVEGFVGGTSTYLCNVLPALADAGFDVTLLCSLDRCDSEAVDKINRLRKQGVKICTVPMTRAINPLIDLYSFLILAKILIKEQFDVVHTHCSKAGALGRIAAKFVGVRKIYHSSHCFAFLRCGNFFTKKIYLLAERFLAGFTTKFIAVSESDADSAKKWSIFTEDQCVVANNGLSIKSSQQKELSETISDIRRSFNIPLESFVVATACRLVEYKGIFIFLEAAKLSKSDAIFVIAGDGPLRTKIEKYLSTHNLSGKIRFLGHVSDMERLYSICNLVVLCSQMEAQPYLILEAMRVQCTIIASDVPGNRELLIDDRGLLVKPEPEKLAQAIDYLLSNNQKRVQFARNACGYFHGRHRLEDQVQKLAHVYRGELNVRKRNCNIAYYCSEKY